MPGRSHKVYEHFKAEEDSGNFDKEASILFF
jgi:hypothetical protein